MLVPRQNTFNIFSAIEDTYVCLLYLKEKTTKGELRDKSLVPNPLIVSFFWQKVLIMINGSHLKYFLVPEKYEADVYIITKSNSSWYRQNCYIYNIFLGVYILTFFAFVLIMFKRVKVLTRLIVDDRIRNERNRSLNQIQKMTTKQYGLQQYNPLFYNISLIYISLLIPATYLYEMVRYIYIFCEIYLLSLLFL